MKLTSFKFDLPKELIALYPTKDRDGSKLMVLHKKTISTTGTPSS
jgi:S-adenosylmethionine:tRNA ribosyltransferase-isomerase